MKYLNGRLFSSHSDCHVSVGAVAVSHPLHSYNVLRKHGVSRTLELKALQITRKICNLPLISEMMLNV